MRKPKHAVALTEAERARLRSRIGQGVAPARVLARARILLKADQGEGGPGWTDAAIAGAVGVHPATVARVRRECATAGLEAAPERKAPDRAYPASWTGSKGPAWSPRPARPRPPGRSAGRRACWPASRCGWKWSRPSPTRRRGGP
jgi:Homeodomain-like domain